MKRRRGPMRSQNNKYFGPYVRFSFEGTERDLSQTSKRKERPSLRGSMLTSRIEELKGAGQGLEYPRKSKTPEPFAKR